MTQAAAPKRFASSRRLRLLLWASVLVVLAGIGTFLGTHFSNTAEVALKNATGPTIPDPIAQKNIPFPEDAWRVAREFAFTAVARKHLAESYAITHPTLRSGFTLRQWKTGTLPNIVAFPTAQIVKYNWKDTNYAYSREAMVNVILVPTKSSHERLATAQIGLRKVGNGSHARWLVDYFSTLTGPWVPHP
ncbi:MAG TPA: hypothetical protein VK488_10025 [Gaiellaceae bacterium]|nr:hypothetical protein [Gaiellaceae bacterium]